MDIEQLEALALADDRAAALAGLIPGTDDHDYYRCIALLHAGDHAEAQRLIDGWPQRHGHGDRLDRLRRRSLLYKLERDPRQAVPEVREQSGANLSHEPEAAAAAMRHPSRLDPALIARATLIARAVDQSSDLSQLTEDGLPDLLDRAGELEPNRRRALLGRLGPTQHPRLIELLVAELAAKGSRGFGALGVHAHLTLDQLHALAQGRPELRRDDAWADAVMTRMRPVSPDWRARPAIAEAYLLALEAFVATLPARFISLRSHVLYHRLDHDRRRGVHDRARFAAYLALPRDAAYVRREWVRRFDGADKAQQGRAYPATDLPRIEDDEALVRDYLHHFLTASIEVPDLADHLEPEWLETERAVARLVAGDSDERWAQALGPGRLAHLRDRVDLDLAPVNRERWAAGDRVALELDVKHVAQLTVKVFRIHVQAWFAAHGTDVDATVDLDGLTARHELSFTYDAPPMRRHRERLELTACDRPGVYVVELIGNGKSSRAVIRKGDLRPLVRVGVAGPVVTIVDERGQLVLDAALWLGGREHRPRADGGITLPFSTRPGPVPVLLVHGELAVRAVIDHAAETYGFDARVHLEREALVAGQTARAIVRAALTCGGRPASITLITEPRVAITMSDLTGTQTTREQPIALADGDDTIVEWPVPEHAATISIEVRGKVRVVSEQLDLHVISTTHAVIASMQQTEHTEALYLARTAGGHVLSLLGRTGEPRPRRAITLALRHRAVTWDVDVTVETDEHGRAELGALDAAGIVALRASAPSGVSAAWPIDPPAPTTPARVHVAAGDDAVVPLPIGIGAPSLVELRGGAPLRDVSAALVREPHAVIARGLAPGLYRLGAPGLAATVQLVIAPADAAEIAGWLDDGVDAIERSAAPARLRRAALDGDHLVIEVADAIAATRVHVIATRFAPARASRGLAVAPFAPGWARRLPPASDYLSGRDLGDEYRYVLERRGAPRRPGTSLERPGLLLNPWALRATSTEVAIAGGGGAYGAPAPRPAAAPAQGGGYDARAIDDGDAFAGHDFLPRAAIVVANLRPDARGLIRIARADLGVATGARVVCIGPALTTIADVALDEAPLAPRDRRLRLALPADGHFVEDKQVTPLAAGAVFEAADLATARVQVIDTVAKAHAYLLTLSGDATLRDFAFVTRWPSLDDGERRALYSKHACHELHLFLAFKDPVFFARVVKPYLAHKRVRTFVDRWLQGDDLGPYLEPWAFGRLNAVERALLAARLPAARASVARVLADAVELVAPDPEGDARRIDALIASGALDAEDALGRATAVAKAEAMEKADDEMERSAREAPKKKAARLRASGPGGAPPMPHTMISASVAAGAPAGFAEESLSLDLADRDVIPALYRGADKTEEWAENDWWHRRVDEMTADLIAPNRFWRDLAAHAAVAAASTPGAVHPFLSPHLGDCAHSFAEAMCALAVLDLPFSAGAHATAIDDRRLRLTAATPCLVAWSQIVPVAADASAPGAAGVAILVGQRFFRSDDRWAWDGALQREKPVTGELIAGVVYACRVVVSNPTGSRERLAVLIQIPRGAIAVGGALPTRTAHVDLEPYGTWSHEVAFYVPSPGRWSCFPVHVTRLRALLAWAPPIELDVVAAPTAVDAGSWAHVSQLGTLDEVAAFLERANLGRVELERIAWRLKDAAAFAHITDLLASRHHYDDVVWAYALLHRDRARMAEWLRHQDGFVRPAGPIADPAAAVQLDPVARGWYQHLEYAPLVNARAHRLGARTRILNAALDAQYRAFLEQLAHRPGHGDDDRLAAAHYLFTMDRVDLAQALLARVARDRVTEQLQYDYLAAYAAVCRGDVGAARAHARPWIDHPVDRWRRKFAALIALLDEASGDAASAPDAAAPDPDSRDQRMNALAAQDPSIAITVDGADLVIDHHRLDRCWVRLYPMDIELLFSRQPFVGADTGRFAFIEPAWSHELVLARDGATRLPVPDALRAANLVVEGVAGGLRTTAARFAHDLAVQVAAGYGQVRVVRASTRAAVPAAYVKVYARGRGGAIAFYKDGYTDVAGRFDYATLSTDDLDRVERFAILIVADDAGATVTEAAPPPR